MATPHISGICALLWQAYPGLGISYVHDDYNGDDIPDFYNLTTTRVHEVELMIGPGFRAELQGNCTIVTTHPRMKEVKVPLNLKALRLLTVRPRMFLLGHVGAGTTVTRSIRLMPAPGYAINRVDLEVPQYPTIEVEATRLPGDDHLWDLAFRIPLEMAGEIVATTMILRTNIEEADPISITLNARVDRGVELGPDIPALP